MKWCATLRYRFIFVKDNNLFQSRPITTQVCRMIGFKTKLIIGRMCHHTHFIGYKIKQFIHIVVANLVIPKFPNNVPSHELTPDGVVSGSPVELTVIGTKL